MRIDSKFLRIKDDRTKIKSAHGEVKIYRMSEAELIDMRKKMVHSSGLNREEVIRSVAAGESLQSIERRKNMKPNEIYHWVKKWEINGLSKDKAIELMIIENMQAIVNETREIKTNETESNPIQSNETEDKPDEPEPVVKGELTSPVTKSAVKIPSKIAKALEVARYNQYGDNEILIITAQSAWKTVTTIEELHNLNGYNDLMRLSQALSNGYEIEKTKEEILEEAYQSNYWVPDHMNRMQAFREGIRFTLRTLGIEYAWSN